MASETSSTTNTSSSSTSTFQLANPITASPFSHPHHHLNIKLTNKNYLYWKTLLVTFLEGQGLMDFIDGTKPCPPKTIDNQPNPSYVSWCRQDKLLISLLLSSLSEETFSLVVGCSTSKSVWDTLAQSLASPSQTRILKLHMELQKPQGDSALTDYLQRLKTISDELAAIGQPIPHAQFNVYIFKGLRPEFREMVAALTSSDDPPSFSKIHSSLLNQEFLNESFPVYASPSTVTPEANLTQRATNQFYRGNTSNRRGRGGFHRGRGQTRGGRGRTPSNANNRWYHQASTTASNHQPCQICGLNNHLAADCYHRLEADFRPNVAYVAHSAAPTFHCSISTYRPLSSSPHPPTFPSPKSSKINLGKGTICLAMFCY